MTETITLRNEMPKPKPSRTATKAISIIMIAFIRTSNRAIVSGNQAQHYRKLAELMEVIGRADR
jgi:hypothetical protein